MPRLATGQKRPYPFQLQLGADEMEFSQRIAFSAGKSRAELFREAFFRNGWRKELASLRKIQKKVTREKIFGRGF